MTFIQKNGFKVFMHVFGSLIFLSLPVVFSPDFDESLNLIFISPFQRNFFTYLLLLGFFYINYYLLIPRFFTGRRYLIYFLLISIIFICVVLLPQIIFGFPRPHFGPHDMPPSGPPPHHHKAFDFFRFISFGPPVIQFIIILIFSIMLRLYDQLRHTEKEKAVAELSYLKAQINPHFLFNTLNSIYALSIEKSDATPSAVVKLSGIMRYIINEASQDMVSLEKEITYIRDYIELQKIRFGDTIRLVFSVDGRTEGLVISPLILITFIENAFKYGINPEKNSSIEISIRVEGSWLTLKTFNYKAANIIADETQSKLGLKNTLKRLNSIYPGTHTLTIDETEGAYSCELKINLI
ncbi:MAG: Sensor histidine kinase YpdA [Bacteroidetes bacterium ADurb.Bin408]|nr:MAG: Sensor histidine kinase YpdA [Bacteroidetes bacterium ADurb.Bin408]